MRSYAFTFPTGTTEYLFEASLDDLRRQAPPKDTIIITDETVQSLHGDDLKDYRVVAMPAGETAKTWETVQWLGRELVRLEAHRQTMLLGFGGGMVTDITGLLATVYMRGLPFGFVPTTLLGMVDAAIGGKNGVNLDVHKNMLGTTRQPAFILFHERFLLTLPDDQWSNGFAEVIKYGHIADARILAMLQQADVAFYQKHPQNLSDLIAGCVDVKNKIVHADEGEDGIRRVLNFGHTTGHAIEILYGLPHGHAIGLGMRVAVRLSEIHAGLAPETGQQLEALLQQFGLPTRLDCDHEKVLEVLRMDKKRTKEGIAFVLIDKPGVAIQKELTVDQIAEGLAVISQ